MKQSLQFLQKLHLSFETAIIAKIIGMVAFQTLLKTKVASVVTLEKSN